MRGGGRVARTPKGVIKHKLALKLSQFCLCHLPVLLFT